MNNLRPDEQQWLKLAEPLGPGVDYKEVKMADDAFLIKAGRKAVRELCQRISDLAEVLRERRQICPICPAGKPCGLCRKADKLLEGR